MLRLLRAAIIVLVLLAPGVVGHAQDATPAASPTACPTTTEEQNATIARRWHEDVVNAHALSALDEILAPAAALDSATFTENPGPQKVLGALFVGFPDVHQTIEAIVTQDDLVVIRYRSTGTQDGEFQGYAPTGKSVSWTGTNIYRIECGRIADIWSEVDALGRIEQITGTAPAGTPTP